MTDLFENPVGLDGFEFIEFSAPDRGTLEPIFEMMGFERIAKHRSKNVDLWRQGGINLITNYEPNSAAFYFAREHGPSACGMGFRVKDVNTAYEHLMKQGGEPVKMNTGPMELHIPGIRGIGNSIIYLTDRYDSGKGELSIYDIDFEYIEGVNRHPAGCGFKLIDHLTHNVYGGRMKYWADFYEQLFNFQEIRYFDIKGEYTGLTSKALTAPDGKIRIPLNDIALICDDLISCWDKLKAKGVPFMSAPPETYYKMLSERLPGHGRNEPELKTRGILLDGTTENGNPRLLLQIFAEPQVGPVFFEFIQRVGDYKDGFGEGNFKALFESIERDQLERGVLEGV